MRTSNSNRVRALFLALAVGLAAVVAQAVPAAAATLWHCGNKTCTVVTSAPAGGVQVLDRATNRIATLYNGNSVHLVGWGIDHSARCGRGNYYVWRISWYAGGTYHYGYIGDYYLATGDRTTWGEFPVRPGSSQGLGILWLGQGSGSCDVIELE